MNFTATPGIAIVESIKDKDTTALILSQTTKGRIIKGKIISMGTYDTTAMGEKVQPERFGAVGDIIYFLHYYDEGGVDTGTVDGKEYYFVKWGDIRARKI